jgi:hypothetical protein
VPETYKTKKIVNNRNYNRQQYMYFMSNNTQIVEENKYFAFFSSLFSSYLYLLQE